MTQKQIFFAIIVINSITINSSVAMHKESRFKHLSPCQADFINKEPYVYQPKFYYKNENTIQYFYPNYKNAKNIKIYDRSFKTILLKNIDSLEKEGASKETLKKYATYGMILLKKNKKRIAKRRQDIKFGKDHAARYSNFSKISSAV